MRVLRQLGDIRVDVVQIPPSETIESFIKTVKNFDVEFVEPDVIYQGSLTVSDPEFPNQYALQPSLLNMPAVWDITTGASSVVVAVVDSGVVLTHPDIASNLWINPNVTPTSGLHGASTIFDDLDGNGDCLGVGETCPSDDPTDDTVVFHGTHVAGIIAAQTATPSNGNPAQNIAGIAFDSRIMAVKVLASNNKGAASWVADGIIYAVNNGAAVINLSLGSDVTTATIEAAVGYAHANNVVVVAASGNTDPFIGETSCTVEHPARIERVIAVGATEKTTPDLITDFSCQGPEIDITAPGRDILSITSSSGTSELSGTSFAAPMVSGVAALLRSLNPTIPVHDVVRYINFNAVDLGPVGFDTTYGFGRLSALTTIQAAQAGTRFVSNPVEPGNSFAYPNPFNPNKGIPITIALPESLGSDGLQIRIFTLAGERVKTLTDTNEWNGRNNDGNTVASGLYVYFAKTKGGQVKGKLTVLK